MRMEKNRVSRRRVGASDLEFGLEGCPHGVDRENVLDLITVIEDEHRFHAAAAVMARDPAERERCLAMAHDAAALLANIRHGLASATRGRLSGRERARRMEQYAYRLMVRTQRPRHRVLSSTAHLQGAE
ncbi:MAG TPA: hypothetical protein VFK00_11815 [Rhodanobacteraceae bacterium]|nr:hypothetical protein [Rhodanobacteraceae bacterium]